MNLKFAIRDIPGTGLSFHQSIAPSEIGLAPDDLDLRSDLDIKLDINRVGNTVLADAAITVSYGFQCARCLEDFARAKIQEFHFDYEIKSPMDVFDVGEDIRQEMILGVVQRALCKNDCKGICPGCGANLNIEPCKCKK
jgi:uncharacterized metal-binding protein YceD (DUF177 family)